MANLFGLLTILLCWPGTDGYSKQDKIPTALKYSDESVPEGNNKEIDSKHLRAVNYIVDKQTSHAHNIYSLESNAEGKKEFTSVTILRHGDYEMLKMVPADGTGPILADNIEELGWLLRHCQHPIQQFLLFGYDFDSHLMRLFREVDRDCFTGQTIAFNSVDMWDAIVAGWFEELFNGEKAILRPKQLQFQSVRGLTNEHLNNALLTYSSIRFPQKLAILDFLQLPNVSRHSAEDLAAVSNKIKTSTIIHWLRDDTNVVFCSPRVLNIQVELLEDRLVDVIDAMFEAFKVDTEPTNYFLLAHRNADSVYGESWGWPSKEVSGNGENIGRWESNPFTGEHMHVGFVNSKDYINNNQGEVQIAGDDLYVERYSGSEEQSAFYVHQLVKKTIKPGGKVVPLVLRED